MNQNVPVWWLHFKKSQISTYISVFEAHLAEYRRCLVVGRERVVAASDATVLSSEKNIIIRNQILSKARQDLKSTETYFETIAANSCSYSQALEMTVTEYTCCFSVSLRLVDAHISLVELPGNGSKSHSKSINILK